MTLEETLFQGRKINRDKARGYGFREEGDFLVLERKLSFKNLLARVVVDDEGKVKGKVIDTDLDEEYVAFRMENAIGEYASTVREDYKRLLSDIAEKAFDKETFLYPQTNRLAKRVEEKFRVRPEFLWEKYPHYAVFRNPNNGKWFALVMDLDKKKVLHEEEGPSEVLDLKLDDLVSSYLEKKSVYPAYHLNRKNWISLILDDRLTDEEIFSMIEISYRNSLSRESFLVPANPSYYDVFKAFEEKDTILWKQAASIHPGDKVYLYLGQPYSAILFGCEVLETDIPCKEREGKVLIDKLMKIRLLRRYDEKSFPLDRIKALGMTSVRSQRKIPKALVKELEKE